MREIEDVSCGRGDVLFPYKNRMLDFSQIRRTAIMIFSGEEYFQQNLYGTVPLQTIMYL